MGMLLSVATVMGCLYPSLETVTGTDGSVPDGGNKSPDGGFSAMDVGGGNIVVGGADSGRLDIGPEVSNLPDGSTVVDISGVEVGADVSQIDGEAHDGSADIPFSGIDSGPDAEIDRKPGAGGNGGAGSPIASNR